MQTQLTDSVLSTEQGREADAILRRCVHCGFCNATCPTYQLQGDELDGPRGRIYLIKQLLEGQADVATAREHLDRCLTCRSCETTCPSGVEYSRLLEIGRERVEAREPRPLFDRALRWGLRTVLPYPRRFVLGLGLGRALRPLLPHVLRKELHKGVSPRAESITAWPEVRHARRVILLDGCVQSVAAPEINRATARLLDRLGVSVLRLSGEVCCGAVQQHLSAPEAAAAMMRRNIDAWWPHLGADSYENIEAIVSTASACGLQVKDYAHALRYDAEYADKAAIVSGLVKDISEIVAAEPMVKKTRSSQRVAFHSPCTLQHGQRLGGVVEEILRKWGHQLVPVKNSHLCCGSAGTYSILQPALSANLREKKRAALLENAPQLIASANIGCLMHLREADSRSGQAPVLVPVKHWVEVLADCLEPE